MLLLLVTYGVPGPGPVLAVSGSDRSCVQTFLVSQLTGGLYGLTELASRGLAVEDVTQERVLTIITYQSYVAELSELAELEWPFGWVIGSLGCVIKGGIVLEVNLLQI